MYLTCLIVLTFSIISLWIFLEPSLPQKQPKLNLFNVHKGMPQPTIHPENILRPKLLNAEYLISQGKQEQAALIYQEILQHPELYANAHEVAFDGLSQYYLERGNLSLAIEVLTAAKNTRFNDKYAIRWYGYLLNALLRSHRYDELEVIFGECVAELEKDDLIFPAACYFFAGLGQFDTGKTPQAIELYRQMYKGQLAEWIDEDNNPCPASFVATTLATTSEKETLQLQETILDHDITKYITDTTRCSTQEFPLLYQDGKIKLDQRSEHYKMTCYTNDQKKGVLHVFNDVLVHGFFKYISKTNQDNSCTFYSVGMQMPNTYAQPSREYVEKFTKLPIKYIENALVIQGFYANYYHFLVEGLPKVFLSQIHPLLRNIPDLKILELETPFSSQLFDILGLSNSVEFYDPGILRYKVKNLYAVEWKFVDVPLNLDIMDYYIPPQDALQLTRAKIHEITLSPNFTGPRNLVIFIHRETRARAIVNSNELYEMLKERVTSLGYEFYVFGEKDTHFVNMTKKEEILLFSRAVILMGVHGAGLSNMMYCRDGTSIIELPVNPIRTSSYSRMASSFNFAYYSIESFVLNVMQEDFVISESVCRDIVSTVSFIIDPDNKSN